MSAPAPAKPATDGKDNLDPRDGPLVVKDQEAAAPKPKPDAELVPDDTDTFARYRRRGETALNKAVTKVPAGDPRNLWKRLRPEPELWTGVLPFVIVLGSVCGIYSLIIDYVAFELRLAATLMLAEISGETAGYWAWFAFMFGVASVGLLFTRHVGLPAAGSGLPEVKALLSGVPMFAALSFRTGLAKVFGLICMIGSGVPVGKIGPMAHIGAITANQMARLPIFSRIRNSPVLMHQMISAGVGAGASASFGCTVGGLLFGIELTSSLFPIASYYEQFMASIVAAITFRWGFNLRYRNKLDPPNQSAPGATENYGFGTPFIPTSYVSALAQFSLVELLIFMAVGVAAGLSSASVVQLIASFVRLWRKYFATRKRLGHPLCYSFFAILVIAILTYPRSIGPYVGLSNPAAVSDLFSPRELLDIRRGGVRTWAGTGGALGASAIFFFTRAVVMILFVIMPAPAGAVFPFFAIGAGLGRFIGELAVLACGDQCPTSAGLNIAGGYAFVGSVALCASGTGTIAPVVMMMEFTGQTTYLLPSLVAAVIALATHRPLTYHFHDQLSAIRDLPFLPNAGINSMGIVAGDIMDTKMLAVSAAESDTAALKQLLADCPDRRFPVINNRRESVLLAMCYRVQLEKLVAEAEKKVLPSAAAPDPGSSSDAAAGGSGGSKWRRPLQYFKYWKNLIDDTGRAPPMMPVDESTGIVVLSAMGNASLPVHATVSQLMRTTPLRQIHMLFALNFLPTAYVTDCGRLVGRITRVALRKAVMNRHDVAAKKRGKRKEIELPLVGASASPLLAGDARAPADAVVVPAATPAPVGPAAAAAAAVVAAANQSDSDSESASSSYGDSGSRSSSGSSSGSSSSGSGSGSGSGSSSSASSSGSGSGSGSSSVRSSQLSSSAGSSAESSARPLDGADVPF